MASPAPRNPRNPINYTVYKCVRCPNGRAFDMVRISASGKNAQRSLQHHVANVHPDYNGPLEAMVGEQIVRQRGETNAGGPGVGNNAQSLSNNTIMSSAALTAPPSDSTPGPATLSAAAPPAQASDSPTSSAQPIPYVDFLTSKYNLILFATIARAKVSKILQGLANDQSVTVGTDEWDQAAVNGQLGEDVQQLAKAAFPEDMYDQENTVCAVLEEEVLQAMGRFYIEKAMRLEARAGN